MVFLSATSQSVTGCSGGCTTARAKRWGSGVIWKIILRDFWADIYAITDRPQGKQLS
jgi:hypothetical protein